VADLCRAHRKPPAAHVLPAPPELLTVLPHRATNPGESLLLVYPDPPLGTDELALVAAVAPDLVPTTPTQLIARR
jgi:hypothetical protein